MHFVLLRQMHRHPYSVYLYTILAVLLLQCRNRVNVVKCGEEQCPRCLFYKFHVLAGNVHSYPFLKNPIWFSLLGSILHSLYGPYSCWSQWEFGLSNESRTEPVWSDLAGVLHSLTSQMKTSGGPRKCSAHCRFGLVVSWAYLDCPYASFATDVQ